MTTLPSAASTTSTLATNDNLINHSSFDDNSQLSDDTDDHDDEQLYSLSSPNNYIAAAQPSSHFDSYSPKQDEQPIGPQSFIVSDQTSASEPILSRSLASSSESDSKISISYGVDWSDRACPTSHCWFPFTSNDSRTAQPCAYVSCTKLKPTRQSTLLQCASCTLVVHEHHLTDSQATKADTIPPCRPSFVDNTMLRNSLLDDDDDNTSKYDEHFWSHVPVLPKPCMHCQRTSIATTLFGSETGRPSMISPLDIIDQITSIMSSTPGNSSPKMSRTSHGLVCLWCSKGYHHSCWENLATQDDKIKCDYGIFRNIIVRSQWLSRSTEYPTGFRVLLPSYLAHSNAKSNSFPYTPVLVFINKRSGGQMGEKIYRELLQKLNPRQVFLLENNATITQALDIYSTLPNIRICVFGGDGTVGWVLGRLAEAYPFRNNPPVSICPLGTGNDLSRVLAWGEQYDPKRLSYTLLQTPQAKVVALDRWQVQLEQVDVTNLTSSTQQHRESGFEIGGIFEPLIRHPKFVRESNRASYENYHNLPNTRFINYMSFGLDAAVTLNFHDQRTRDPSKFSSPLKNKLMYLNESGKYLNDFVLANMWNLGSYIRLICDGQNLTHIIRNCHSLVVLNIPGYASGTNPWGKSSSKSSTIDNTNQSSDQETFESTTLNDCATEQTASSLTTTTASTGHFERQDFGDRKIEVVGLSTKRMAAIHVGFSGRRIAQCNRLRIELCCPMTAQMDGEPFYLPASVAINISHAGQVLVLKNENK
ncbi:unnamed protein product [Rotaria sordida]|uniref:Diacylglycerol kinase n=2 Tax=Rotaria sordida TaxID=392033 RepID=A0A814S402_9BILA|nr:unnamed protein product [Rotaria sordida]